MKKLVLVSFLAAVSLLAADIASEAKMMSDAAYENKIKVGKLENQAFELRAEFRERMRSKLDTLSDEDRAKFMEEFRKNMSEKIDKLTVKEARELGFGRHFARGDRFNCDMRGGPSVGQGRGKGAKFGGGYGECGCANGYFAPQSKKK